MPPANIRTSAIILLIAAALGPIPGASGQVAAPTPRPPLLPQTRPATTPKPWPFGTPGSAKGSGAAQNPPPPRENPLVEKPLAQISLEGVGEHGRKALAINPPKWKHAETENFILHYRRVTEAQKVAREVEYDLWYIATVLGATRDRYQRKSHVYIFEDEEEWKQFLSLTGVPSWSASFAYGDELFLNMRRDGGGFSSNTLAHETSHAVVARLFPGQRWPLWLSEGFAEYMGGASVAARKGQTVKRHQNRLDLAEMPLARLEALTEYPSDENAVGQLYQTSEKFVRFLMNELPKERIVSFIEAVLAGKKMQEAVLAVYGDKLKDWDGFMKRYERFNK